MKVNYLDLQAQDKENREVRRVIYEILSSEQPVIGPDVEEFDRNLIFGMRPRTLFHYACRALKELL